jgi:hypothetical protein
MRPGENPTHDHLVVALLHHFAGADGVRALDRRGLDPPEHIGDSQPAVTAVSDGRFLIGVAKTGYQLVEEQTRRELTDYLAWRSPNGERAVIHLVVPAGWRERAEQAYLAAGGQESDELNNVLTVDGLGVPGPDEV